MKPISMFDTAALDRQNEQKRIENELKNIPEPVPDPEPTAQASEKSAQESETKSKDPEKKTSNRKVHMNINLPKEYVDRLKAAAADRHQPASYLIECWIDEHLPK